MKKKKNKAETAEAKGDKAFSKKKFKKALSHYRQAQKLNPDNLGIYDKLVEAHRKGTKEWTREDFSLSLEWTMKKQELENPDLKKARDRLDPDKARAALLETLSTLKRLLKK
ncbi:MAG: hypothetical protein HY541_06590 [Deltaproteobacteria bacterium]|nr:hypothetical protein [Deltaproteobacteria bacterium]